MAATSIPPAPGPVGVGPGYWSFDAWGGGWRNDWVDNGAGGYMLSGSGAGSGGAAGARAMPTLEQVGRSEASSPHFNAALAAAWAAQHPNGGTAQFNQNGNGVNNPDFNPDIWGLLGRQLTPTAGGGTGADTAGGPMPPGAGGPTYPNNSASALFAGALGAFAGRQTQPGNPGQIADNVQYRALLGKALRRYMPKGGTLPSSVLNKAFNLPPGASHGGTYQFPPY